MTRRDFAWRAAGAVLVSGSISVLQHRLITADTGSPGGSMLALASFMLAMMGTLLIINGARLHDEGCGELKRRASAKSDGVDPWPAEPAPSQPSPYLASIDPAGFGSGQLALTARLIERAEAARAQRRKAQGSCSHSSSGETGQADL